MAQNAPATAAHDHPNYMAIFWWLLALTIAELVAATVKTGPAYPQAAKVFLLVGLALGKAALVAAYFMHLRFEKTTLSVIAVTPLILCVFLLFMLIPDRIDRTHIHSQPASGSAAPPGH
jgi:cytochrome c oxidase subunit 4